jgi:hypothetical protein
MSMPNDPDDLQARMKGLVAGQRGRGFVEVTPSPPPAKDPLEELRELLRREEPRRAKRRSRSSKR